MPKIHIQLVELIAKVANTRNLKAEMQVMAELLAATKWRNFISCLGLYLIVIIV